MLPKTSQEAAELIAEYREKGVIHWLDDCLPSAPGRCWICRNPRSTAPSAERCCLCLSAALTVFLAVA